MNPQLLQLHNLIVYGQPPTQFVDFGEFSVEFSLRHYTGISPHLLGNISILEKCIEINGTSGKEIVKHLPEPLFDVLLRLYREFQIQSLSQLTLQMDQYVMSDESRAQWILAKAAGVLPTLTTENGDLNPFQRTWVVRNSLQDKTDHTNLIIQVIDLLKPWLDKELYSQVQERMANTRENILFNDDDTDELDAQMRARAAESAEAMDIIQIKEPS